LRRSISTTFIGDEVVAPAREFVGFHGDAQKPGKPRFDPIFSPRLSFDPGRFGDAFLLAG
jgi:hypothetical protein